MFELDRTNNQPSLAVALRGSCLRRDSSKHADATVFLIHNMKITRAKGGTAEKTVELSKVVIPDLWHIAQAELDLDAKHKILDCWHLCHDLKRALEELESL